jgi:hypothetical protein
MRNTVSHKEGGILTRGQIKKSQIFTWRTRALDSSMVGQLVDFTPYEALKLFWDQMDFVRSDKLK